MIKDYDRQEDLNLLQINVEETIIKELQQKWKTMDEEKLKYLIRKQIISELLRLEERK